MTRRFPGHPVAWLTAGAIALRFLLFLGRGDYVAFDEGWYLLLGRNLWSGEGFTLSGLRHVALSPLFPILAGALDLVVPSPVWAGRIVAAVSAGLLVVPTWAIFRRLAGRRTALLACGFIAVMPSLAPFVVPYWIGWDLWVGAEPLLHLLLFSGLALTLRALERRRAVDWALAGAVFSLAYLARPEAVIAAAFIGAAVVALSLRDGAKALVRSAIFGLAFAAVSLPYWLYLHDALGRWALTGRSVAVSAPALKRAVSAGLAGGGPADPVERMLWEDGEDAYIGVLYGLDASGTSLADSYWGIPSEPPASAAVVRTERGRTAGDTASANAAAVPASSRAGVEGPAAVAGAGAPSGPAVRTESPRADTPEPGPSAPERPNRAALYARALGVVLPWFLWPLVAIGVLASRPWRRLRELLVMLPLAATSLLVALLVAIDPRTQLFLAPALALYTARGIRAAGVFLAPRLRPLGIGRRFATTVFAVVLLVLLLGIDARRLYMSTSVGSPHHIVGAANLRTGRELERLVPAGAPVMSWHPALALYAGRDWRVLPFASLGEVVRYAAVNRIEHVVLAGYYPPRWTLDWIPGEYLILRIRPEVADGGRWRLVATPVANGITLGELRAEPLAGSAAPDGTPP